MAARPIEVCDAVASYVSTEEENGTYGFTFNILRVNPAHHRLESTNTTWLYIYPGPEGPTTGTRSKWRHTYSVTLHLVNFVDGEVVQDEIDQLFLLMERILDSLKDQQISGMSLIEFSTEDSPEEPFVNDSMVNMNLCQSVRRAMYQEYR